MPILLLVSCDQSREEVIVAAETGVFFLIVNHTGHTYPHNQNVCGSPVTASFVLKSNRDTKEIVVPADDLRLIRLDVDEGREIDVRVSTEDGHRIIAKNMAVFRDNSLESRAEYHSIRLCKNTIEFNF